jgi:hypothetical protein
MARGNLSGRIKPNRMAVVPQCGAGIRDRWPDKLDRKNDEQNAQNRVFKALHNNFSQRIHS